MNWKNSLANSLEKAGRHFDDLSLALRERLGLTDPVQIVPYRSYGTSNRLYLKGRVLEDKLLKAGTNQDTVLTNLLNMYKRFESDEVPNAVLKVTFQDEIYQVITDQEGYFTLNLAPKQLLHLNELWHKIDIELQDAPIKFKAGTKAAAEVLIPPADAEYGIISDIDDTIVHTAATDVLGMARTVFLNNAHTRLPFAGVSEFYKSLQLGRNGKRNNPFFYVSSSPWNMYDLLKDYLGLNEIPAGPLLLRDFGMQNNKFMGGDHMGHKFKEIENILLCYPQLNFILIGDSGQEDPVIYREVVKQYPGRILAIYIRDVQLLEREKIALKVSEELSAEKVDMLIIDNASEAAAHAAKRGFIFTEAIPQIEQDKNRDKGKIPGKEEVKIME